jgi:uncharacterized protein
VDRGRRIPIRGNLCGRRCHRGERVQRLGTEWDGFTAEPDRVISDGNQAAARGWYSGTYKQTGKSFRARFVHWYTVTDGKIARFEQVVDSSKVNEAL